MKYNLETFIPRDYQLDICDALENRGFKKIIAIWPRRAGKDIVAFNLILRQALLNVGNYAYCLPKFAQARRVIWDCITIDGKKVLDFIPECLIKNKNQSTMTITLINDSKISLIGSDKYDSSLVGTNVKAVVFSEYCVADDNAYKIGARPILNANNGSVLIISTPRGRNHLYDLYNIALNNPKEWYVSKLTLDDTKHISKEEIQKEIDSGEISEDLVMQEYYTSFDLGAEGSYYGKYIDKMRLQDRIGCIHFQSDLKVHTAWDLGVANPTVILFFQVRNNNVYIFDYYQNNNVGLEHYVGVLQEKQKEYGFVLGTHIAPHDARVKEFGSGITRIETALRLGIRFKIAPNISIEDGIERVRTILPRTYIDEKKCKDFIKSIEFYHREFDNKRKVYHEVPCHDWSSDCADALRMLAVSLSKIKEGMTPEELSKIYNEAVYGNEYNINDTFKK